MLAITLANLLFTPAIGEQIVDPATRFAGANTSDILQHLLTVLTGYVWVLSAAGDRWSHERVWCWRGFALLTAVAMVVTYVISDGWRTAAEEYELQDPASLVHGWLVAIYIVATFALICGYSIAALREPGVDLRTSQYLLVLLGGVGVVVGATSAVLLAADPAWLAQHYHRIAETGAISGLLILAVVGLYGLTAKWSRRNDPRS